MPAWAPLLAFAGGLWGAAACTVTAAQALAVAQCLAMAGAALGIGAVCAAFMVGRGASLATVAMLGCCAGCLAASMGAAQLHVQQAKVQQGIVRAVSFTALDDSREGEFGSSCLARAELPDGKSMRVRVNLPDGASVRCWETFQAKCQLKAPSSASAAYYWRSGCVASASPYRVSVTRPGGVLGCICRARDAGIAACESARLRDGQADDAYALLQAVLFGYRQDLFASGFYDDVKTVGLAHIVAVSGSHLVIVSGFFSAVLCALRLPKLVRVPLQVCFVFAYAAFAGMPVSALRAAVMTCCALSSHFARRRSSSITALSCCIVFMVSTRPFLAVSVSLALSSFASLGIVLLAGYFSEWFDELFAHRARFASQTLAATLAANVLTVGVSCAVFSQLPLVSPLSNLLAAPLFTAMVCAGVVSTAASLAVPALAPALFAVPAYLAKLAVEAVNLLAGVPFACIPIDARVVPGLLAGAVAVFLLLRFRPRPSRAGVFAVLSSACCLFVCVLFVLPKAHGTQVVMLDVGQGDAVVYRSGGHAVLVDTGTNDSQVLAGLARHDVRTLDAVLVTHPDDDHCGSLQAVLDAVPVGRVLVARGLLTCDSQNCRSLRQVIGDTAVGALDVGDVVSCGRFTMSVVSPGAFQDEGGNADSVVCVIEADCDRDGNADWTVLAGGDAEADVLGPLAESGAIGKADILKVPHHGSKAGLDDRLVDLIGPKVSLISVGAGNRYGHPTTETLDMLARGASRVYRTDECGDVVCNLTASSLKVSTSG